MDLTQTMAALEAAGTETNRRIYLRHGMREPLFGVSWATLGKLQKQIKRDQPLAAQLWATGNGDARNLAAMIADPALAPVEHWVREVHGYPNTDALAKYVAAPSSRAAELAFAWIDADAEWTERAGWGVLTHLAMGPGGHTLPLRELLARIERDVHAAKNRVRDAMLGLLAAIGLRDEALREVALAAARRIGPVEVDHGDTACETIDAASMIEKGWARRAAKGAAPPKAAAAKKAAGTKAAAPKAKAVAAKTAAKTVKPAPARTKKEAK